MNRPCSCDRVPPSGGSFDPERHCRRCWRYHHDPAFRALWGGGELPVTAVVARLVTGPHDGQSCRHFGLPVVEADGSQVLRQCGTCPGMIRQKVFHCAVYGEITLRDCQRCQAYQPK